MYYILYEHVHRLPLVVRKRIRALKNFQLATTEVEAEFYLEVQKLEAKYLALYQPIFDKRKDIVTGSREPTDEEAHWSDDGDDDEEEEEPGMSSIMVYHDVIYTIVLLLYSRGAKFL